MHRHVTACCAALFVMFIPSAGIAASPTPPVAHFHAMPCIRAAVPTALTVSWHIDTAGRPDLHRAGHTTVHPRSAVHSLYGSICGYTLVSYDRPLVCACPAVRSMGVYHLAFLRGGTALLRVTERAEGMISLTVDGHARLGSDTLPCLILLPGVPTTPYAGVLRPGERTCRRS